MIVHLRDEKDHRQELKIENEKKKIVLQDIRFVHSNRFVNDL